MDPLDALRASLGARYSADTVRSYTQQAGRYLAWARPVPTYSREQIRAYLDSLIAEGKARASVEAARYAVKALCDAVGAPWPLERRDMHLALPQAEGGPALRPAEVDLLIRGARAEGQAPGLQATALATTWGLRAIEIAQVLGQGMDGERLALTAAKGGRPRSHLVPASSALQQALTFPPLSLGRRALHDLFERLMVEHVRRPRRGEGWHAVRRALVTGLLDAGAQEYALRRWMGWRGIGTLPHYYHPQDGDAAILAIHPFLRSWL